MKYKTASVICLVTDVVLFTKIWGPYDVTQLKQIENFIADRAMQRIQNKRSVTTL
jgi:hypothetical protein